MAPTQEDKDAAVIRLAAELGGSVNARAALRVLERLNEAESSKPVQVVEVTGSELSGLLRLLRSELRESGGAVHTFRVSVQGGGVMFKFNEGGWTHVFGTSGR
jgi:hypothetical protein